MPEHHLSSDSKDVIKLGMGLIATIAALVLGLVIATAKSSFDTQGEAVKHTAAKIILLDSVLSQYGPETRETRDLIRRSLARRIDQIWPEERSQPARLDTPEATAAAEGIEDRIRQLTPRNDAQRDLQSRGPSDRERNHGNALVRAGDHGQLRTGPVPCGHRVLAYDYFH